MGNIQLVYIGWDYIVISGPQSLSNMLTEPLPLLPLGRARRGAVVGAINPKLLYADGGFKQRAVVIPSFRQVFTRQADARLK